MSNTKTKIKTVNQMTRKEIESVPRAEWDEDIGEFDSLVILPLRRLHDSGYRTMDFVACKSGVPFKRLSGWSDVIHLDGIGGYGENWLEKYGTCPTMVEPSGWSIDCLKVSGLLQLFSHGVLTCGASLSSFELYTKRKIRNNQKQQVDEGKFVFIDGKIVKVK